MPQRKIHRNRGAEMLSFLSSHPGMPFTAHDIQHNLNFPTGEDERRRIVATLGYLTRTVDSVTSPIRGTWSYTGKPSPKAEVKAEPKAEVKAEPKPVKVNTPETLEVIGKLTDGDFVGKGDDNEVYRIKLTKL